MNVEQFQRTLRDHPAMITEYSEGAYEVLKNILQKCHNNAKKVVS